MDGAMAEKTSEMVEKSLRSSSIGTIDTTGEVDRSCGGTGQTSLDDDKNGGSIDGRNNCGAVKKDNVTGVLIMRN